MKGIVVCNSAAPIALAHIGRLDLLQHAFQRVIIPRAESSHLGDEYEEILRQVGEGDTP